MPLNFITHETHKSEGQPIGNLTKALAQLYRVFSMPDIKPTMRTGLATIIVSTMLTLALLTGCSVVRNDRLTNPKGFANSKTGEFCPSYADDYKKMLEALRNVDVSIPSSCDRPPQLRSATPDVESTLGLRAEVEVNSLNGRKIFIRKDKNGNIPKEFWLNFSLSDEMKQAIAKDPANHFQPFVELKIVETHLLVTQRKETEKNCFPESVDLIIRVVPPQWPNPYNTPRGTLRLSASDIFPGGPIQFGQPQSLSPASEPLLAAAVRQALSMEKNRLSPDTPLLPSLRN